MKKQFLFVILFFFGFCSTVTAQSNSSEGSAKNAIYINGGSIFTYHSIGLNYDLRIRQSAKGFFKNYYLNMETGIFNRNSGFAPGSRTNGILGGIGIIGLTGQNSGHFEIGLGVSLNVETNIERTNPIDNQQTENFIWPDVAIGYRLQKENGFLFRTGIGFPRLLYIGLGYSF